MKIIKLLILGLAIVLLASIAIIPVMAAPGDNIALNVTVESCSYINDDEKDEFLVDNDVGYTTKWCAVDGGDHTENDPYHWIILDFGEEKTFYMIRLVKASEGERDFGQTQYDASAFYFEISLDKYSWKKILDVTGNEARSIYESAFEFVKARYLKLVVVAPEADPDNHTAAVRLYDLKVFEGAVSTTVREPVVDEPVNLEILASIVVPPVPRTGVSSYIAVLGILSAVTVYKKVNSRKNK